MIAARTIEAALEDALGGRVELHARRRLSGGCIGVVEQLETNAGTFVLKSKPDAPPGFFAGEAAGLEALRASRSGLVVPGVVAAPAGTAEEDETFLVLEYLPQGERSAGFDERLGLALASLHRTGSDRFGFPCDTWCGTTRQDNAWQPSWIPFYAAHRLGPQIERAAASGRISASERHDLDRIVGRLDQLLIEPEEGPALLHGDLWSGNVMATDGARPAVLDPAACFGHREAEFGMTSLFGGLSERAFASYLDAWRLAPGWQERQPIYQLYHLLNHLNLFGGGYHDAVVGIVGRFR